MDLSLQEQKPAIEYTAQCVSPLANGEVRLAVGEHALTITALFDTAEVPYAEMTALQFADYTAEIKTTGGDYAFSRMGAWAQPFYDALCGAYNKAVLRSLFIKGSPILTSTGEYRYTEKAENGAGTAPIHVFETCVVSLPPDLAARRVPLCFAIGMDKADFELTLKLNTGESYTYAKLGYDTAPFADAVENQIRKLREKTLAAVKELDGSLSTAQASRIASLVPEGAAAPVGQLAAIAPSFVAALEEKIAGTRAAESYKVFRELCDPARMYIGFRKNETGAMGADIVAALENPAVGGGIEPPQPDPYLLWMIAPSPDGQSAAVEFAEADSATFVYSTGGDFNGFAKQLNRALEAIGFKREVIRLSGEELKNPENADYLMAANRTASLQFVRRSFTGRIIHSGADAWKRKLAELWRAGRSAK